MHLNRLQKFLTLPLLFILGFWSGCYLRKLSIPWVPWLALACFVAFLLTFLPRSFWMAVVRVINNSWSWIKIQATQAKAKLGPKIAKVWDNVCDATDQGFQKARASFDQKPNLWLGGAHVVITILLFLCAYAYTSWELFHFGLVSLVTSPLFFINHYNKWSNLGDFISDHRNGVWLGVSIASCILSYGHAWGSLPIIVSAVSALCAIITIAGWWGGIGKGIEKAVGAMVDKVNQQLHGDYGLAITLLLLAFATLVVYSFFFMEKSNLEGVELDSAKSLALLFVGLFIVGLGVLIRIIHRKM